MYRGCYSGRRNETESAETPTAHDLRTDTTREIKAPQEPNKKSLKITKCIHQASVRPALQLPRFGLARVRQAAAAISWYRYCPLPSHQVTREILTNNDILMKKRKAHVSISAVKRACYHRQRKPGVDACGL
jgi:hypothetical protein